MCLITIYAPIKPSIHNDFMEYESVECKQFDTPDEAERYFDTHFDPFWNWADISLKTPDVVELTLGDSSWYANTGR